ncbi:hypothetical protein ACJIZ3_020739 [Penstemon smallii]|uniref:Uncharacterized protein n=1 Tax=Penstemon smallii TaxID=265156 RepID=A0ABD3SK31_9LAMI
MEESGNVNEIQVRSLTGESIRVSMEPNKTVQDLKLLLKQSFSLASSSPNFHLFLKGVKLKLQSEIGSYLIGDGDFVVFVPFTKKDKQQMDSIEASKTQSEVPNPNEKLESKLAESAWSELMQDVSSLRDVSGSENPPDAELKPSNSENENNHDRRTSTRRKHNRMLNNVKDKGPANDLLLSILQTSEKNMFDEQNLKKILEFIDSSRCLSDPATGSCVMTETKNPRCSKSDLCTVKHSLCLCPLWLKDIMSTFAYVNIYSACLQLWHKKITFSALEEPLDKFHKSGFHLNLTELENLSQVCPQIISIVNHEVEATKFPNTLVVIRSAEKNDQHDDHLITEATKRLPMSKIVNSMKKREATLKACLLRAVVSLMFKNEEEITKSFSLEDLIFAMKAYTKAKKPEMKRERGRNSDSIASSSCSYEVHCQDTYPLLPEEMVGHLKSTIGSRGQVAHIEEIRAREAKYVEIPHQLSENVKFALNRVGITRLYSHQAESIQASLAGKNVIVATMTSSGKSLCYNVPVLEVLLQNPSACALYLFPTKALAQDQLRALSAMANGLDNSLNIGIYDGDTSKEDRLWLRDNARLLFTNPDMLHLSILPFHGQFRRILSNLRFIIIDEAHAYKGAFGCHAALILRRLRRICSHVYSSDPSFVFSTATSANPREHAM